MSSSLQGRVLARRIPAALACLWILAGAVAKLLIGTPADMPSPVRDLPLPLDLVFKLAISVEMGVAWTALWWPRRFWILPAGLFVVFGGVLVLTLAAGDASCGCFGTAVTMPPAAMLALDATFLAALLAARPWSLSAGPTRHLAWVALALIALPWIYSRSAGGSAGAAPPPAGARAYAILDAAQWGGKPAAETPLARWVHTAALPQEGVWILYRNSCEHCADYLLQLAAQDDASRPITLIRIPERKGEDTTVFVHVLPEGPHVTVTNLAGGVDYVIDTPAVLDVSGGTILSAREGVNAGEGL